MGITINLYSFSKKANSTSIPYNEGSSYDCVIKEPCGILSPKIKLNIGLSNPSSFNYAYISSFARYYFIREWIFEEGLWVASLEVDVLASWKSSIGGSTCYVLRSSQSFNGDIIDTTYPAKYLTTYEESQAESPWITDDIENGMFVVGVAGQATTYYLFTKNGLDLFFSYLFSDLYAKDLTTNWSIVFTELKAQCDPLQYIASVMWIPFHTTGTSVDTIRVGWVDVPCTGWRVDGSGLRYGQNDWELRKHPQANDRGNYLNSAPFSTYSLFYPPWGLINLDASLLANSRDISVIWGVDLRTGQGTLTVAGGELHTTSWIHSQVGVNYQVSQVVNKGFGLGNLISGFASIPSGLLSANYGGVIANTTSAIGSALSSKIPSATTIGSSGGLESLRGIPALQYEFKELVNEDLDHRGRPLCENVRIDHLNGYIMVADADISVPSTLEEQNAIRSYMEGGFFFE